MSRESQCITVIELYKSRMKPADIVRMIGYKKQTVYDAVKRHKETVLEAVVQLLQPLQRTFKRFPAEFNKIANSRCAKWLRSSVSAKGAFETSSQRTCDCTVTRSIVSTS